MFHSFPVVGQVKGAALYLNNAGLTFNAIYIAALGFENLVNIIIAQFSNFSASLSCQVGARFTDVRGLTLAGGLYLF